MIEIIMIYVILMSVIGWFLYCNNKTYLQRSKMLDNCCVADANIWQENLDEFKNVTYDQHWIAIFFFKDPYALYDQDYIKRVVK